MCRANVPDGKNFQALLIFCQKRSAKKFRPENFWNFQISIQKFLGRPTFNRNFFRFSTFEPEKIPGKLILQELQSGLIYDGKAS